MKTSIQLYHGHNRSEDSQRAEGRKAGEAHLQPETHPSDAGSAREAGGQPKDRIVWITNTTQRHPPFVCPDVTHTSQILAAVQERIPQLNLHVLGVRLSPQQSGACNRRFVNGYLSSDVTDIYVEFYLRKHPTL